jgi:hypothetical protein
MTPVAENVFLTSRRRNDRALTRLCTHAEVGIDNTLTHVSYVYIYMYYFHH